MTKNSFILYDSYKEQINLLSMEERGELLTAIFCHRTGEEIPKISTAAAVLFSVIRAQLDRDAIKYKEMCDIGRENGHKGAEFGGLGGRPCRSYEEIIQGYNFTDNVNRKIWQLIQSAQANGQTLKNDKLTRVLNRLNELATDELKISYINASISHLKQ